MRRVDRPCEMHAPVAFSRQDVTHTGVSQRAARLDGLSRPVHPARAHFDALFAVHQAAALAPTLERAGLAGTSIGMTALLALFHLRDQHPLTPAQFVQQLTAWPRTGGSASTLAFPLDEPEVLAGLAPSLIAQDLVWEMGAPTKRLLVSPKGVAFLAALRASMMDREFPVRMAAWERDWPAAIGRMEAYLRGFFGQALADT